MALPVVNPVDETVQMTEIVVSPANGPVVGTDAILQKFDKQGAAVAAKFKYEPRKEEKRLEETLASLRALNNQRNDDRMRSLILSTFHSEHSGLPSTEDLCSLALHHYPPRATLKAFICDFYEDHAEKIEVDVGDIEAQWQTKPEKVKVRWIHAPIGRGLYHSSLEDLYRHVNLDIRPFSNAGHVGFPYVEIDSLNFRHRKDVANLRDTYCMLSTLDALANGLDETLDYGDRNKGLQKDLEWRANHLNVELTYWDIVASDMPWQIADGLPLRASGPLGRIKPTPLSKDFRILSNHPSFLDAQLVRNEFRFFHRNDGFLLTMSAAKGVDYLDARLDDYLQLAPEELLVNPHASVVGYMLNEFTKTGTKDWHKPTPEWLVVYLLTELGVCPHNDRQGHNTVSIMEGYQDILCELRLRTYEPWRRDETVQLAKKALQCIEEVRFIDRALEARQDLFRRLRKDVEIHEQEDREHEVPFNLNGVTSLHRIDWALGKIRQQREDSQSVLSELHRASDDLLHIRSIEQNELTIIRDSQQRAIMLFTAVTVIFLPLSFCTSYFGMNLRGIADTDRSEQYFWYVCGTIGFAIVIFLAIYAFWQPMKDHLVNKRMQRRLEKEQNIHRKMRSRKKSE